MLFTRGLLVRACLSAESWLRRYFGLPLSVVSGPASFPPVVVDDGDDDAVLSFIAATTEPGSSLSEADRSCLALFRCTLVNFVYDTYLRLLIANHGVLVTRLSTPATIALLWALEKLQDLGCVVNPPAPPVLRPLGQTDPRPLGQTDPRRLGQTVSRPAVSRPTVKAKASRRGGGRPSPVEAAGAPLPESSAARDAPVAVGSLAQQVRLFSERIDSLRQSTTVDILLPQCIQVLQEFLLSSDDASPVAAAERGAATFEMAAVLDAPGESGSGLLTHLKTFCDVRQETKFVDHTDHFAQAFAPVHRFGDSRLVSMNMARHIGSTMRENIRSLYVYIAQAVADPAFCPCVVLFDLFVRDNYRMYHSRSLQQTSFVSVRRSDGSSVNLSYMIITNRFPRVHSWFKSINNQLAKKVGRSSILHLDAYVRALSSSLVAHEARAAALAAEETTAVRVDGSPLLGARTSGRPSGGGANHRERPSSLGSGSVVSVGTIATTTLAVGSSSAVVSAREQVSTPSLASRSFGAGGLAAGLEPAAAKARRRPRLHATAGTTKPSSSSRVSGPRSRPASSGGRRGGGVASGSSAVVSCVPPTRREKCNLSSLYRSGSVASLLSTIYDSQYVRCQHRRIARLYEQYRANDESATLVRVCRDCGTTL